MGKIKTVVILLASCTMIFAQDRSDSASEPKPARPQVIRVSAGVLHGLVNHAEPPEYPEEALKSQIQGDVIVKVRVEESGRVILITPVEGDPLLTAASVDALREFRFRPYLLNGMPLKVESQVGFHFSIAGNGASGNVEYLSSVPFRPEFRTGIVTDKGVLVLWPRKISGEEPQLPPELAGKAGSVYLTITIGEDGNVKDVKVLGGDKALIEPVVAAVKKFVYEPQLVDGKASVVTTQASFHFGSQLREP
jgi:TonB family protein